MADALADDDRVIGGQSDSVDVLVWNAGTDSMSVTGGLVPSAEWHVESDSSGEISLGPGEVHRVGGDVDAGHRSRRHDTLFPPPIRGRARCTTGARRGRERSRRAVRRLRAGGALRTAGTGRGTSREVSYRVNDQAHGEVRRPVVVVPRVDVELDPAHRRLVRCSTPATHRFTVTLTHGARDTTTGTVAPGAPRGLARRSRRRRSG